MIKKLKEATRELHEKLEEKNLAYLIIKHEIKVYEYQLLLLQNYIAYAVCEHKIEEFFSLEKPLKNELLLKDLSVLEIDTKLIDKQLAKFKDSFSIDNKYEALGAKYVVDGSALGGMQIAKNIPLCDNLKDIPQPNFFSGDRAQVKQWNSFSKILKKDYSLEQENLAIKKAKETFIFFDKVFSQVSL